MPTAPTIINLARSYDYQSAGDYASLLAEARGHRVIPSVETVLDLAAREGYARALPEFEDVLIRKRDLPRLAEFDALFIRETTSIRNHTYRFAQRARAEGMPAIDDPISMIRCTNKVYLWERLTQAGLPTPRTLVMPPTGGSNSSRRPPTRRVGLVPPFFSFTP